MLTAGNGAVWDMPIAELCNDPVVTLRRSNVHQRLECHLENVVQRQRQYKHPRMLCALTEMLKTTFTSMTLSPAVVTRAPMMLHHILSTLSPQKPLAKSSFSPWTSTRQRLRSFSSCHAIVRDTCRYSIHSYFVRCVHHGDPLLLLLLNCGRVCTSTSHLS